MSVLSNWSYTAKATFWTPTLDSHGQPSGYTRSVFNCSFRAGGRQAVDNTGEEFVPTTVIYLESAVANAPQPGSFVALEESVEASPVAEAETVRSVKRSDESTFAEGLPDYEVMTS